MFMAPILDDLAGNDFAMARVVELCRKIADKDFPLLILGETGVGKDTLARAVHTASNRSRKPFVAFNCAAIPSTLLASELFGYAPGTFTDGAKSGYAGKLVESGGGTFFLDEIGDMPLDMQAYLLRVLEERSVNPLGCNKSIPLDIRFISATHCDLLGLVAQGRFRQDLYYRISGVRVMLPALRMRQDLGHVIDRMTAEEAKVQGKDITLSSRARDIMCRHDWPGNFRELKNLLRVTISSCERPQITVADLPHPLVEFASGSYPC